MRKLLVLGICAAMLGCSGKGEKQGTKNKPADDGFTEIELSLNWYPEAEHGGFIAAEVLGFFEREKLRVKIRPGGPGAPVIANVGTKRTTFAVANADQVLLGREREADVVAVMTAMQDSPRCLIVRENSGITELSQLKDMTLAVGTGKPYFEFLKRTYASSWDGIKTISYKGNVAPFLLEDCQAVQGYVFSEPFVIRETDRKQREEEKKETPAIKIRPLMVSSTGFNPYASLLITHGDLVRDDPELVARVVRACRDGWRAYLKDPEATNKRINEMRPDMSLEALKFGVESLKGLCITASVSEHQFGEMTEKRWKTLFDQLKFAEMLPADSKAVEGAFTTQFTMPQN